MKFKSPEDELEEEAEREREAIKKLLGDSKPKAEPEPEEEPVEEVVEETPVEEPIEEEKEYTIPDPDDSDFEVVDFAKTNESKTTPAPASDNKGSKKKLKDREFNHPAQRDSIKDSFLDSLISIKIRSVAATVFTLIMLVLEILAAANVISDVFKGSPVFRVGGDEFLVVLQKENLNQKETLFQQFELACSNTFVEQSGAKIPVSIATGFAKFDPDTDLRFADVFKRADDAMYENKRKIKQKNG
jgi:hypothetical protein